MHLFFIDESGTISPPDKIGDAQYFALGGVVIPEDRWAHMDKELSRLKSLYMLEGEIKWRYFAKTKPGSKSNTLSHLSVVDKERLRWRIYQLITQVKSVRVISAIVHIPSAYAKDYVVSPQDLYWHAYWQLIEKFQYYLQDLSRIVGSKINGIVICDHRQPSDDDQLRLLHQTFIANSKICPTFKSHLTIRLPIPFNHYLIEGVFIAPSHLSVGIQLADMVGGAIYRKFARGDSRYHDQIIPAFRKSEKGVIEGYGLIRWPK